MENQKELPFNKNFFRPLAGKNVRIYIDCINELISYSGSRTGMYEKDVLDVLTMYFKNIRLDLQDDEESGMLRNYTPRQNAGLLLSYFRKCGWIGERELGRNGDNTASVTSFTQRFFHMFNDLLKTSDESDVANSLLSMYEVIRTYMDKSETRNFRRKNPYTSFLKEMQKRMQDLKTELRAMHERIHALMKEILDSSSLDELCGMMSDDGLLKTFFSDYYRMKQEGYDTYYLGRISELLDDARYGEGRDEIVRDYMEQEHVSDMAYASEYVEEIFAELDAFVSFEYAAESQTINNEIDEYYDRFYARMITVKKTGYDMQKVLDDLLTKMADMKEEERDGLLEELSHLIFMQDTNCLADQTFIPNKVHEKAESVPIEDEEMLSDEEKRKYLSDYLSDKKEPYTVEHARKRMHEMIGSGDGISSSDDRIKTKSDAITMLVVAANAGSDESEYSVILSGGYSETKVGKISNIKLVRRPKDEGN